MFIAEEYSNVYFENNFFKNNYGNGFFIKKSSLTSINNSFENFNCFFDNGCVYKLQFSNLLSINNRIENISNTNEGGAYYSFNSILHSENDNFNSISSNIYSGCILCINSSLELKNFGGYEFSKGCLYLDNSSLHISNSYFSTSVMNFPVNEGCYSTLCGFNLHNLSIINSKFLGNINNTLLGGVIIIILKF